MAQLLHQTTQRKKNWTYKNQVRENYDTRLIVSEIDLHLITGKTKDSKAPGLKNINFESIKHGGRKAILLIRN